MNNLNKDGGIPITTNSILKREKVDEESTFHSRMMNALSQEHNQNVYDVTFIVGSEKTEIGAHKIILQMQSPKFREISQNDKDAYDIIAEDDATPEELRLFLEYLYTGVLPDNITCALSILQLAGKYDIPDLKHLCCNRLLEKGLELKSVVHMQEQATKYGQIEFVEQCEKFMLKNGSKVLNSTGFLQLTNGNLRKLIRPSFLLINNEMEVFKAVLRWGKNQCAKNGKEPTGANLRNELKDLIPLIRFPCMDKSEFASEVIPTEILTDKEILSVLFKCSYSNRNPIAPTIFDTYSRYSKSAGSEYSFYTVKKTIPLVEELRTYHKRMSHELFIGNQNAYDVTFIVGSKRIEIGAHRTILQIQCPKLYEKIEKSLKAYNIEDDCTPAEFRMFLQFLYTGVLTDNDRIYASYTLPLLKLAIKYDVPDLRKACNPLLETNFGLQLQCAVQMYEEACQYGQPELKQKYLDFICQNGSKVLYSTEFLNFTNQNLCTVIASDNLITGKEMEVFRAVVRWGKKQCVENLKDLTVANLRNELEDLIPLIRFPLMRKMEFSKEVVSSQLLSDKEIISVLLYYNAKECKKNQIAPGIFSPTPRIGSKLKNDEEVPICFILAVATLGFLWIIFMITI